MTLHERGRIVQRIAARIRERADDLAMRGMDRYTEVENISIDIEA